MIRSLRRTPVLVGAFLLVAAFDILAAQQSPAVADTLGRAVRAARAPAIDGREDDAVWRIALVMSGFRHFDSGEDPPSEFRTAVRVAYDDRFLHVFVRAHDPHPDSIAPPLSRRDVKTASDQRST